MKIICVIPARYNSKRFKGKVLADIDGKPMIQHVYERVADSPLIQRVIVATDDNRIMKNVQRFGGEAVMTPDNCRSGTDRVAIVAGQLKADIVLNVQGDEPLMPEGVIDSAVRILKDNQDVNMSTAAVLVNDIKQVKDPNVVKVVVDRDGYALYFSRSVIPAQGISGNNSHPFLKHIGIYVYRKDFLKKYVKMELSPLEKAESLEQLRVLENGYRIKVAVTEDDSISVDTEEDLKRVKEEMKRRRIIG